MATAAITRGILNAQELVKLGKMVAQAFPKTTPSFRGTAKHARPKAVPRRAPRSTRKPIAFGTYERSDGKKSRTYSGKDTIVSSLEGSVAYACNTYEVNPGLAYLNKALSLEAARYDEYKFTSLSYRYVPSSAVTTTAGMVGMAFDPNPNSSCPDSLQTFTAYECHKMASAYEGQTLNVPKSMLTGWRFVRNGVRASNRGNYDPGLFVLSTQDEATTAKLGFIEVHYTVKFRYYHLSAATAPFTPLLSAHLSADQAITSGVSGPVHFDTVDFSGLPIEINPVTHLFHMPPGTYELILDIGAIASGGSTGWMTFAIEDGYGNNLASYAASVALVFWAANGTVATTYRIIYTFEPDDEDVEGFLVTHISNFTNTASIDHRCTRMTIRAVSP